MNDTLDKILASRKDLSDYLFHFTKGNDALKTLEKIISEKKLKAASGKSVICFTEAPVFLLTDMFRIFDGYPRPMYAPYGIAFRKDILYNKGARPVFYGDQQQISILPNELKWLSEPYIPNVKDFAWLREWRINSSEFDFSNEDFFIILKTIKEEIDVALDFQDVSFDGDVEDGGIFHGFATGEFTRDLKSISLESINTMNIQSGSDLKNEIDSQSIDETLKISLGSFTQE